MKHGNDENALVQFWHERGDIIKGAVLGMIIAHNGWHTPVYDFSKGWMAVGWAKVQPAGVGSGWFAGR